MGTPVQYGPMSEIQMNRDEIDEITKRISEMPINGLMTEWGSGGSTVKWLETMTGNQKLISVEHNKEWYNKVNNYIQSRDDIKDRFTYYHRPELYSFEHGYATVKEEHPYGLDAYVVPDEEMMNADIFFIDGVGRAACLMIAAAFATKNDPIVYIHDYYGREHWYNWATQFFKPEKVGQTLVRLHF